MRASAAVACDRRGGQSQGVLHRQCDAERPGLRQRQVVSVDALVAAGQRRVVGVADETDRHVLFVPQVVERLHDLFGEVFGDGRGLVHVPQGHDEVLDARPPRVAFLVVQLADGLRPADFDALDVVGDDDLLVLEIAPDFVVPDLDLDATIERPALFGQVRGDRLRLAGPLVGDGFGRKAERILEVLGHLAGTFPGEARVVPEDAHQGVGQRLRVRVPDEVDADVLTVPHPLEDLGELVDVLGRNIRHAGFETDRRYDVLELDGLELFSGDLLHLQPVAALAVEQSRVLRPPRERLVAGEMPLDLLARPYRFDRVGA